MADESKREASKIAGIKKFVLTKGILIGLAIIALVGVGVGIYYFLQYQKTQENLANPAVAGQLEVKGLVEKIGNLVELPTDEVPTVATVSDINKLKDQSFFARAHNGDKVLIYSKAKKAILYRPSSNKIVEFGPINVDSAEQNSASISASVTPELENIKLVLRNGTKTVGLASSVEKELKVKAPTVTVVARDNASKQEYTKTIVIDLTGANAQAATHVAELVAGEVGKLPTGEVAPSDADILVILGRPQE